MLKKQSIRSNQKIFINKNKRPASKDEVIALSEFWTDKEEGLFRKSSSVSEEEKLLNYINTN